MNWIDIYEVMPELGRKQIMMHGDLKIFNIVESSIDWTLKHNLNLDIHDWVNRVKIAK